MKKINLILASALVMGALAVNAQDSGTSAPKDSTGAATQDRSGQGVGKQGESASPDKTGSQGAAATQGTQGTAGSQGQSGSNDFQKDMIIIKSSEMPESLRNTLGGNDYKGWEGNSTIYRSRSNDQFVIEMREGNKNNIHRFDKDGKAIKGHDQKSLD